MTGQNDEFPGVDMWVALDELLPWASIEAITRIRFIFERSNGWQCPLPVLLRIYLVQRICCQTDAVMVTMLKESVSVREFTRLPVYATPSASQLGAFRRFMEKHGYDMQLLNRVGEALGSYGADSA